MSFTKNFLVKPTPDNIISHISDVQISNVNKYAKYALEHDNDTKKKSKDEAASIHIITSKLNTHLSILYETQISSFYGKPDFIIRLGKNLYIMVSTTQAVNKKALFTEKDAYRLMQKKLNGLYICSQNLDCLVDEVISENHLIRPVLHILSPCAANSDMCNIACSDIIKKNKNLSNIKIVISIINSNIF